MDMMSIRKRVLMGSRKKEEGLPDAYQRVEYIESTGTQYIDTGIIPTINTINRIKFMNTEVTGDVIYGYWPGSDPWAYRFFNYQNRAYFDIPTITGSTQRRRIYGSAGSCKPNEVYEFELGYFYIKDILNNEVIASQEDIGMGNAEQTIKLNLYGIIGKTSTPKFSKNRWYYVKIFEGSEMIRNFIPCYRKSDGEIGMYDTVSKTFFANAGTGTFLKGADV